MKLNIKRTVFVGLAFMTIMMLWQVYNWYLPLFLNDFLADLFSGDKLLIGIIMALDNLFALFMIPLMSRLSDKTKTKLGRRVPYIIVGILASATLFLFMPYVNNLHNIWLLLLNILFLLISMNIYRSPCVALMPDITPKPLRSKGNSVINILGGVGIAIGYLSIIFFSYSNYIPFYIVSIIMVIALVIFLITVNENRFVADYRKQLEENGMSEEEDQKEDVEKGGSAKTNIRNVLLILAVVFFVYMANNSVETFISLYSEYVFGHIENIPLNMNPGALVIVPFGIASFAFAIPAALIADKLGRRKAVLIGAICMAIAYLFLAIMGMSMGFSYFLLIFFFIAGIGFSLITINIYPMVIENCSSDNVGKYTGHYYTASMLAQSITPAFCGLFMSGWIFNSMRVLFPYAFICMIAAIITLCFIKENKSSIINKP